MEYIRLIGVLVIILGFAFKLDTVAVVLISALATALASGIDFTKFLAILGQGFLDNRMVSLFFLTLPMIGVIERNGLKASAVNLIHRLQNLTPGRIFDIYLLIRELACVFGITLQGQVQFIRPLINPMAQAAAIVEAKLTPKDVDRIKARSAATENFGNFFAQNLFVASGGVLLMASTMKSLGYKVDPTGIVLYSIPVAVITLVLVFVYNRLFDRQFTKKGRVDHD